MSVSKQLDACEIARIGNIAKNHLRPIRDLIKLDYFERQSPIGLEFKIDVLLSSRAILN